MLDLAPFRDFAARVTVPTKEFGNIRLGEFFGTQEYLLREIEHGWSLGIQAFVILKGGRQVGGSTLLDLLALWWLQVHAGMIGQMVSDDLGNMNFRRLLLRQMLASLEPDYRLRVNADNQGYLQWENGSTLLFDYAGVRPGGNLGRSKGLNFLYADEVGSWTDEKAVGALKAAFAETYPERFYAWISTARGFNVFSEMWQEALTATSTRAIFLAWWMHQMLRIDEGDPRFKPYSQRMTSDERLMVREVKRRYAWDIQPQQLVWYRWKKAEEFLGDDTLMSQEYGSLPEECFQAFGDKFIEPAIVKRLQAECDQQPAPEGFRYLPGKTFDQSKMEPMPPKKAPLLVWEQPIIGGAYIVALHAWGASSPKAQQWVAQVWRAWPDYLAQCAEYTSEVGTTYAFAWLALYLAGGYRRSFLPYIINEIDGPGSQVAKEIQLMRDYGYGFSDAARAAGLHDFVGAFSHYFWARPDNLGWKTAPIDMKSSSFRLYMLHALADTVTRGNMLVRSPSLITSMAALRRGETGDADEVGGGGGKSDAHAMCAALAVRCWQDFALGALQHTVMPAEQKSDTPRSVGEYIVGAKLDSLLRRGRM